MALKSYYTKNAINSFSASSYLLFKHNILLASFKQSVAKYATQITDTLGIGIKDFPITFLKFF
jgi:hypothetical protein